MICPKCHCSDAVHPSTLRERDRLFVFLRFMPYRCWNCYARFYRLQRRLSSLLTMEIDQYVPRVRAA